MIDLSENQKNEASDLRSRLSTAGSADQLMERAADALDQVLAELQAEDGLAVLESYLEKLHSVLSAPHHTTTGFAWTHFRTIPMPEWRAAISDHNYTVPRKLQVAAEVRIETYCKAVWFYLWLEHFKPWKSEEQLLDAAKDQQSTRFKLFRKAFVAFFPESSNARSVAKGWSDATHCFACLNQLRRATLEIARITGTSNKMQEIRRKMWEAVFTRSFSNYQKHLLHLVVRQIPVLLCGPTGSGKTLAAEVLANSAFMPFSEITTYGDNAHCSMPYQHLVVAEHPETLLEGALFGYSKGAYTGATRERLGAFEECKLPWATLFLDEIGDLPRSAQVMLLKVLQNRQFCRVGGDLKKQISFEGRVITATNVNLQTRCANEQFRLDLYFRLAGCVIEFPTLKGQLLAVDTEERRYAEFTLLWKQAVQGLFRQDPENTFRILGWLERDLLRPWLARNPSASNGTYHWPGNFRELQQCANSLLLTGDYRLHTNEFATNTLTATEQMPAAEDDAVFDAFSRLFQMGWNHEGFLAQYGKAANRHFKGEVSAADKLGVDPRTLKRWQKLREQAVA